MRCDRILYKYCLNYKNFENMHKKINYFLKISKIALFTLIKRNLNFSFFKFKLNQTFGKYNQKYWYTNHNINN